MAFQYFMPGSELKQELLSNLTVARSYSRIIKFFDLLFSGQEIIKQTKNAVPDDSDLMSELLQKSNAILEKIKEVLATVSAEDLIQKLSAALRTEIKTVDKKNLESVLVKINNHESSITSLGYLESLINSFDRVVKLYLDPKKFNIFIKPDKDLTQLKRLFNFASNRSAMDILILILQITVDNVVVSSEEKSKWQCLLLEAADVIKEFVKWDTSFQVLSLEYILQFRSCVQCILDLFDECPAEYGILLKELDKINDCKKTYDSMIKSKCEPPSIDDSGFEEDIKIKVGRPIEIYVDDDGVVKTKFCEKSSYDDFISKIPPSHTWWKLLEQDQDSQLCTNCSKLRLSN